jgi:DNA-binding MarR family transcriptional regulator
VSATRASKVLKSLEQRGLVTRALDPADHRREQVFITDKGVQTVQSIFTLFTEAGTELFGGWQKDVSAGLSRSLHPDH